MTPSTTTSACETHLSRLFFSEDRVYKMLKPVVLPFVDFSDRTTRLHAATVEFERNRRISPDVYLGVADITENDEVVDRMIVMRRLDAADELGQLLAEGPQTQRIREVARHIAHMHADLEPLVGADADPATVDIVGANWHDNFAMLRAHVGTLIDPTEFSEAESIVHAYLDGRGELFRQRIEQGWVRDGHGDLRAEHVYCTPSGPRLIDCVAFNDRLRICDALSDVAFLAMDLDRLAGEEAAKTLMRAWNEFTNEHHPSSLAHFYVAYRAHVRCKIAALRHSNGDPLAARHAVAYHRQARHHLEHARIRLILVGGGAGSGKSTIASGLAESLGAVWLRADEIRKDIAGIGHNDHDFAPADQGTYSPDITERTHREMRRQAGLLMRRGVSVVVDTTWRSTNDRNLMRSLGNDCAAQVTELRCELPRGLAKERIARRMASMYNPSDATPDLVDHIADRFESWPEATPIDTAGSVQASLAAAMAAVLPEPHQQPSAHRRFASDVNQIRDEILLAEGIRG